MQAGHHPFLLVDVHRKSSDHLRNSLPAICLMSDVCGARSRFESFRFFRLVFCWIFSCLLPTFLYC
jgi:hypothetical protein